MTNREWLESLSDREFAEFMMSADTCSCCIIDIKDCECFEKDIHCVTAKILWLRAEHKDD